MLLVREELRGSATPGNHALSIGVFDGVHCGHRMLVQRMLAEARERGLGSGIITFHPSPITVLRPNVEPSYLESLEQRVELLRDLGVDFVSVVQFTSELAQVSFADFARILSEDAGMRLLVAGEDFALGRAREGSMEQLAELGRELDFEVVADGAGLRMLGRGCPCRRFADGAHMAGCDHDRRLLEQVLGTTVTPLPPGELPTEFLCGYRVGG